MEQVVKSKPALRATAEGNRGAESVPAQTETREDASRFCPVCSRRLKSRRCKLICDACGYYMSCADYY